MYKKILILISGRIFSRLSFYLLNIVLFYVWDKSMYGEYAARTSIWNILQPMLSIGITKCSLKLLPIYKKAKVSILESILIVSASYIGLVLLGFTLNLIPCISQKTHLDLMDMLIGVSSLLCGFCYAIQGIGRAIGNNKYDYRISVILGCTIFTLAITNLIKPTSMLFVIAALALLYLIIDASSIYLLLRWIGRQEGKKTIRIRVVKRVFKESMTMGLNALIGSASYSIISGVFRYFSLYEEAGYFSLAASFIGFFLAFFEYVLGLCLPRLTYLIHKHKEYITVPYLKKYIKAIAILCALSVVLGGGVYIITAHTFFTLLLIWVCFVPIFMTNEVITLFCETVSFKNLLGTTKGLFIGAVVCGLLSVLLIPYLNSSGALFALVAAELCTITFLIIGFWTNNREKN